MAVLSALAGAAIAWTVPKALDWLSRNVFGGGKKKRGGRGSTQAAKGGVTKTGRATTTELPGGDKITELPKYPPGLQKFLTERAPEILKKLEAEPEKYPGAKEFVAQQQEIFGPQEGYQRTDIPGEFQRTELPGVPQEAFDFDPIAAQATQQFKGEILPGLAERFTALTGGGQRSGAFARQTTRAGERLAGGLAALRAQMQPEMAFQRSRLEQARAGLGLQQESEAARRAEARAALGMQQEGEAARLGLAQRGQQMAETGFLSDLYGRGRATQEQYLDRLYRTLYGEIPSTQHIAAQPARAPSPGFMQQAAPGIGALLGGIGSGIGQAGSYWLGKKYGLF